MLKKLVLSLIIILGVLIRFYQLGDLPNSYSPDEVAQAYTAYSILNTGKDEWGNSNPFILRSFGDYKAPLQTWLMIPSIKIFGLTPFSARFPNALLSSLAIISTALLTHLLFKKTTITILSTLLIAVSPWHFPMSRIALEANFTVFFSTLATYIYLKKPTSKVNQLIASLLYSVNLFSYHSAKFFTPILILATYLYQSKPKNIKTFFSPLLNKLYLILPFSIIFISNFIQSIKSAVRVSDISILNPTDSWVGLSFDRYLLVQNQLPDIISRSFNNKLFYVIENFFSNVLSYFSPQFLITQGAGETTYGMLSGYGVLGLIPTIALIYTIFLIFKDNPKNKDVLIYLSILVLASTIPAALAKGSYPANRLSSMIPFLIILSSYGLYNLYQKASKFLRIILIIMLTFSSLNFITSYFFGAQHRLSDGMLYGRQQAMEYLLNYPESKILISRSLSQPQAYYTFFTKVDPNQTQINSPDWLRYQEENKNFLDQLGEYHLNNTYFKSLNQEDFEIFDIIIAKPEEFRDHPADIKIFYPNSDKPALYIYNQALHEK